MNALPFIPLLLALVLSPLLPGVINRTKALFAGRRGQPLLQTYFDLWKLLQKGAVYSRTTTWLFRAGPIIGLAATLTAVMLMPLGNFPALIAFPADFLLFAGLLGVARFFIVVAALDTGSSFEGMGASREVFFSALAEPALLVALATLARQTGTLSLSTMFGPVSGAHWLQAGPVLMLVVIALMILLLAENARIPVDDPNTHLELTMIHEVMVLDHGGPDLAFVLYSAALKLWLFAALIVGMVLPATGSVWMNLLLAVAGMLVVAVVVGVIESVMARLRLVIVPQLLVGAGALVAVAFLLSLA
ncbi:MAG TPA: NADH-quinone oxidoreductase subunit H [Candidatus Limnocylindrales bacterium]|nr:NADH-quinone oxidoreductase subunit H [Candidatus Limnocylindrales bacterium]